MFFSWRTTKWASWKIFGLAYLTLGYLMWSIKLNKIKNTSRYRDYPSNLSPSGIRVLGCGIPTFCFLGERSGELVFGV